MESPDGATELRFEVGVALDSKSRPFPMTYRGGGADSANPVFETQLFSNPAEDLLEAHIASLGRDAIAEGWTQSGRYAVDIALGKTSGGGNVDIDNVAKLILDSLSGVVWKKDKQVDALSIRRTAAERTLITVSLIQPS